MIHILGFQDVFIFDFCSVHCLFITNTQGQDQAFLRKWSMLTIIVSPQKLQKFLRVFLDNPAKFPWRRFPGQSILVDVYISLALQ